MVKIKSNLVRIAIILKNQACRRIHKRVDLGNPSDLANYIASSCYRRLNGMHLMSSIVDEMDLISDELGYSGCLSIYDPWNTITRSFQFSNGKFQINLTIGRRFQWSITQNR